MLQPTSAYVQPQRVTGKHWQQTGETVPGFFLSSLFAQWGSEYRTLELWNWLMDFKIVCWYSNSVSIMLDLHHTEIGRI